MGTPVSIPRISMSPILLDNDSVDTIHESGGTMLGSSRGQQDTDDCRLSFAHEYQPACSVSAGMVRSGARAISLRSANAVSFLSAWWASRKTIDNDLYFVGRSFGFETAVAEATSIIQAAHTEAKGTFNGVGLVKLMGRDSGFIAVLCGLGESGGQYLSHPGDGL
jgi:6-phosphofructokinase 1